MSKGVSNNKTTQSASPRQSLVLPFTSRTFGVRGWAAMVELCGSSLRFKGRPGERRVAMGDEVNRVVKRQQKSPIYN